MDEKASNPVRQTTLAIIAARADGATVCPSEVARVWAASQGAADNWRDAMPVVHDAVDELLQEGMVRISWKGNPLASRSGPYRLHSRIADTAQE